MLSSPSAATHNPIPNTIYSSLSLTHTATSGTGLPRYAAVTTYSKEETAGVWAKKVSLTSFPPPPPNPHPPYLRC